MRDRWRRRLPREQPRPCPERARCASSRTATPSVPRASRRFDAGRPCTTQTRSSTATRMGWPASSRPGARSPACGARRRPETCARCRADAPHAVRARRMPSGRAGCRPDPKDSGRLAHVEETITRQANLSRRGVADLSSLSDQEAATPPAGAARLPTFGRSALQHARPKLPERAPDGKGSGRRERWRSHSARTPRRPQRFRKFWSPTTPRSTDDADQ